MARKRKKKDIDPTPPIWEGDLDPQEIEHLKMSGWRRFVTDRRLFGHKKGSAFWVPDGPVYGPTANTSFEKVDGELKEIPVFSLPTPTYIGNDGNGNAVYSPNSGWTVTDIDTGKRPKIPGDTRGLVRTQRGWQFIQRGFKQDLQSRNDADYIEISKERGYWNQRVLNRDMQSQRTLSVRMAEYKKDPEIQEMAKAWKKAGGIVRAFTGYWKDWKPGKGKLL